MDVPVRAAYFVKSIPSPGYNDYDFIPYYLNYVYAIEAIHLKCSSNKSCYKVEYIYRHK